MKKETKDLISKYYDQMVNDINNYMIQAEESKMDSFDFYNLSEKSLNKFRGYLDALSDLGFMNFDEWEEYFNLSNDFCYESQRTIRKWYYDCKDPVE